MSIEFDNGFLLGLAVAYKKAAVLVGFGDFLILPLADGLLLSSYLLSVQVLASATQPEDVRPPTADSVDIAAIAVTDAVQMII